MSKGLMGCREIKVGGDRLMFLAAMLRTVLLQHTGLCLSFHLSLHSFLRMSIPLPSLSLSLWLLPRGVLLMLFLTILIHIATTTPCSFRRSVDLISFSSSSAPACPRRRHLQHQTVVSVWHSEGDRRQSACQKSHSSNHRHGRSPLPSRNGQSRVREERITSRK